MNIKQLIKIATNKNNFTTLKKYIEFSKCYLDYISNDLQAVIVSQNETNYNFYQYKKEGKFQITRPINTNLMYTINDCLILEKDFISILANIRDISKDDSEKRRIINNSVYTLQQSIGAALDALPAGSSNKARKLNGDLFEQLIKLVVSEIGIECKSGVINVPVIINNEKLFDMSYQHDLIIEKEKVIKLIGSIKTSSKDRIDKIFIDKYLYSKLTDTVIPHIAIFLNDVQRKNTSNNQKYGINATFLPGHFKGYTIKLNPLDGVYYCDIRPNMKTENILKDHIKTFDYLVCNDIWNFID